jgi:hypothetical protein
MPRDLRNVSIVVGLLLSMPAAHVDARDISNPTWPCVQRKIPTLTSTQVWNGPAVEDVKDWERHPAVRDLVLMLSDRRVPIAIAEARLADYAKTETNDLRATHLTLVFAGVFEKLHNLRSSVMTGLERYLKAQRQRAAELERQGEEIAHLKIAALSDEAAKTKLDAALEQFTWAQKIFDERQASLIFACEVPVRIDARIFELGKAISELMNSGEGDGPAP